MTDAPMLDDTPGPDRRNDDADDWLEALAGRPRPGAAPGVNREAALLREASRRWPAAAPALSAEQIEAQLTALLAAAHADPALAAKEHGSGRCAPCEALRRWFAWRPSRWAGAAALATVALLAAVVLPWQAPPSSRSGAAPDEILREPAAEGIQRLRAADAQALRDRIADQLAGAGLPVARYERLGRYGLDAELPAPLPDAVRRLLREHGLAVPPGGGLAVEIEGVSP